LTTAERANEIDCVPIKKDMGGCCSYIPPKSKYEDFDWNELPQDAQKAAEVLGYNENKWNKGKDTKTTKKYWNDLSDEEHAAAEVLGYDHEMWDA